MSWPAVAERLLREHDTAVVPGHFLGTPPYFRIAFGVTAETLERGLEAISRVLER